MKQLPPLLAVGAQLLGCSMLLAAMAVPTPAQAQSDMPRTCRAALGEQFSVTTGMHQQRCCYVAEERPWYKLKGVVLGKVYLTADNRKVRPRYCTDGDDEAATPAETPHSLLTPGDDPPKRFRDVYY